MTIVEPELFPEVDRKPPIDDETIGLLAESLFATLELELDEPAPVREEEPVGPRSAGPWRAGAATALAGGVILAIATFLRVANLARVGFNSDEAVYAGQGASLLGVSDLAQHFSIFRAHPLLLQLVVGGAYQITGPSDHIARLIVAVVFGVGSVGLTMLLARDLYRPAIALVAGSVAAFVPYHVVVSRQVLVDTPMAFFVVLSLLLAARAASTGRRDLLYLAFAAAGLAALSKEIAVLLVVVLVWWLLTGTDRLRWSRLVGPLVLYTIVVVPFPATRLVNRPGNASDFVLWQFTRAPNHDPDYFFRILLQFGGVWFLAALAVGLAVMVVRRNNADRLVLMWCAVFGGFFQFWPTKLFPYLYVIAPALAIAAAVGVFEGARLVSRFVGSRTAERPTASIATAVGAAALALTLISSSAGIVMAGPTAELGGFGDFDIEVQSFAGGREFGQWATDNTPENARFVTMGPSLGNILRFYGRRDSVAMSVSPDPARRNPAYVPIINPDLAARQMAVHYIAWDAYSADRSAFYNGRLRAYARKHGGSVVFSAWSVGEELVVAHGPPPDDVDVRIIVWDIPGAGPLGPDTSPDGAS